MEVFERDCAVWMEQRADIDGSGNITVQIVGENNQVTVARAVALRLTMFPRRRKESGDMGLLSPYTQSIELIGRDREMRDLRAWLASERDIAIQVRVGEAGAGKTRLAFDLCDELLKEGEWQAGFVNGEQLAKLVSDAGARWGWDRPTLAVVDYAAERADVLRHWLAHLADYAPVDGPRLRILLLERQAETGSGWLQTALGIGDSQARSVRRMLDPAEPVLLPGLIGPEDRRAVLDSLFAKLGSPIHTPTGNAAPAFDRGLAELTWGGAPLFLMMAAHLAIERSLPEVLALPRTQIAHDVAKRELGRIRRLAQERKVDPDLLVHLAAYVTLCQGLHRQMLLAAIETEAAQTKRGLPGGAAPVADALADALPGTPAAPEPIRPDALGEAVVLQALGDVRIGGAGVVLRAFAQVGAPVAAFVIRTAQDFVGAGYETPLKWLDVLIDHAEVDLDQLRLLADTLPQTSLALLEHAARLTEKITICIRNAVKNGGANTLLLPAALNNLSNRLSAVGRRHEALAAAKEAADLFRALAALAPDASGAPLATTLNNLAISLSEVGRRQEALALAQEAIAIRRALAEQAPDAYRPDLAASLNNLANRLGDVGRWQEALAPAQESVAIRRALAEQAPDAYGSDLAAALSDWANRLSEAGRRQEALAPAQEAVDIRRKLAAQAPDAYRPALASSLSTSANRLGDVGRSEEALAPAQEAVEIRRLLAEQFPDAYRPDLARSLSNLGVFLRSAGQPQEALVPAEEAVAIRRELSAKAPTAFGPDLAMSLCVLAQVLSEVGRRQDAFTSAVEAVRVLAPHFLTLPQAYAAWMQTAVGNYLERCKETENEPDVELLGPIVAALDG